MRLRRLLAAPLPALVLAVASGVGGPLAPRAALAAPVCQVTYTIINTWNTGFQANVNITNNGPAITSWTLAFQFPEQQQVTNGWAGTWTQNGGPQVSVVNAPWDGALATGATIGLGFVGSNTGANDVPDYFTLNGTACNGALQRPTVSLTAPAANAIFTAPAGVTFSATAASTSGGSITQVQFLDNGTTVLGTATSSPFSVTVPGVAAGVHVITARAFDSNTATANSLASLIFVGKPGFTGAPAIHVSGNRLVDANGNTVVLRGTNRSGAEFGCVPHAGFNAVQIFDGPVDAQSVVWIASWNINAVRIPLNEDCWNGASDIPAQFGGATYQAAIVNFVNLLHQYGIVAILDLHWTDGVYKGNSSGCADFIASCQKPMPDTPGAIPFWTSVANTFKGDQATVLDLFNEPFPERALNFDETKGWTCWRDGGAACPAVLADASGANVPVAGMQSMVNAVRATGARNVLMLGGLAFSNDMTQWLNFEPTDPAGNLVASWHSYNFNVCITPACWTSQIAPVAARVPLVAGEIGENDCAHTYIDPLMSFLDGQGAGYLGWTWNVDFDCARGPGLVSSYAGTPTAFGIGLRTHLLSLP
jgi:hypothetical protein